MGDGSSMATESAGRSGPSRTQPDAASLARAEVYKHAIISPDDLYRYSLWRAWGTGKSLRFVMLNPSTADASLDDPTIRRCMGFARREGYDGLTVLNLYAYRSTDPKALLTCADAVGPDNDRHLTAHLMEAAAVRQPVVAAWGANAHPDRVGRVLGLWPDVDWRCLGTTKQGAPRHPLYVRGDQPLISFDAPRKGSPVAPSNAGSGEAS